MIKDHFVELFDYTDWANRCVWDCVMQLSQADFEKQLSYSVGSIHVQCVHMMSTEYWWLGYLRTGESKFISDEETDHYRDRAKLRTRWDDVTATNKAYLASVTDEELGRTVRPNWFSESKAGITVAQALTQVANHSTDHRAQILAMLHTLGAEGVEQDFLNYLHRDY